ncbi:MAG: DsbA family protein [Alphaproteobacteria bacterium]|nr:DsbA family protein [Alphaproteobacteria bacterium]
MGNMQKESIITILASVILSVGISAAVTSCGKKEPVATAPSATDLGTSIETYLKSNPSIIRETLELAARKEQEEAEKRIAENYKKNIDELHNIENSPYVGPKDAKVTIVEFFDFNCGYCKRLAPALMKVLKDNPDVRFVFKPVGFLGPTSLTAAKAVLAAHEQGKFIELYEALLSFNGRITDEVIDEQITKVGLDLDATKKLMSDSKITKKFEDIAQLSRKVEVRGVPTLIINGAPLRTIDAGPIQSAIDNLK